MNPGKAMPFTSILTARATMTAMLLAAGVALGACTSDQRHEYLAHTDRVTSGAGDAVAANKVAHTIDPWPPHSAKTQIDMDGKRAGVATKRYETNTTLPPKGLTQTAPDGK